MDARRDSICALSFQSFQVYKRLGLLNLLDTSDLDRQFVLDLSLRDERLVAEMLVGVAHEETGKDI